MSSKRKRPHTIRAAGLAPCLTLASAVLVGLLSGSCVPRRFVSETKSRNIDPVEVTVRRVSGILIIMASLAIALSLWLTGQHPAYRLVCGPVNYAAFYVLLSGVMRT
jgi:hypothetical protein